jgi:hypothetical protein
MDRNRADEILTELRYHLPFSNLEGEKLVLKSDATTIGTEYYVTALKEGQWGVVVCKVVRLWPWWTNHSKFENLTSKWTTKITARHGFLVTHQGEYLRIEGVVVNPNSSGERVVSSMGTLDAVSASLVTVLTAKLKAK